jgi:hypothetical protein
LSFTSLLSASTTKDIVSITGVDFSGNNSNANGNLLTKLFFVIKNIYSNFDNGNEITNYWLFSCNAAFGNNTIYYDQFINSSRPEIEDLIKNGLFLFNSSGKDSKVDQIVSGNTSGTNGPFEILGSNSNSNNIYFQEVSGNVVDVAPNGTSGTGYIYIAGGDHINNKFLPSIRKYTYSGSNTINEIPDCSWNVRSFDNLNRNNYTFNAIGVYDISNVVVVGNSIIAYTKNGGTTWQNINSADSIVDGKSLTSVSIYDLSNAIAVGNHGTIIYSTDGYKTWNNVPSQFLKLSTSGYPLIDASFNNVAMLSKNEFVVSNVISTFKSESGTKLFSPGSSKIIYNYVPALFNNENNNVIDICGNMTIAGDIHVDDEGEIITNNQMKRQKFSMKTWKKS